MKSTLLLRIDSDLKEKLRLLSRIEKRSMCSTISKLIEEYIVNYQLNSKDSKNGK